MVSNTSCIEDHHNITTEPDIVAPDNIVVHVLSLCLLAPCYVRSTQIWIARIKIRLLIVCLLLSLIVLRWFLPTCKRVRLCDFLLYIIGIRNQVPGVKRRELAVLALYGFAFHNMLNFLNSHQMAFKITSAETRCYRTVQDVLDANIVILANSIFTPHLADAVDPALRNRITTTDQIEIDFHSKRHAYLLGCDVARYVSQTVANFDQRTGTPKMAPVREPFATIVMTVEADQFGPEFAPETGLLEFEQRRAVDEMFREREVTLTTDSTKNFMYRSYLWEVVWIWYSISLIVFVGELVVHRVQGKRAGCRVDARKIGVTIRDRSYSEPDLKVSFRIENKCGYVTA